VNDDGPLVKASLAGDMSAFGQLVDRHQDRLYNTMFRLVGNAEDASDVVQETFIQALVKLKTFRGSSAFYTWLYRIAFNMAMTQARRRRPHGSLDSFRQNCRHDPKDEGAGPDELAIEAERAELVHAALQSLADEFRQVIVLREFEGLAYEEIAEILDVPVGTIRSRLFRGRSQLRQSLAASFGEVLAEK
jgi:RNA polymerase sigma-70 factor (ECF subfamily)